MSNPLTVLDHSRVRGRMVYVVRSRRSRGISVGVNLFPHRKVCDLDCVYCEVVSADDPSLEPSIAQLRAELEGLFRAVAEGRDLADERINDVAFSGDGEPTISPLFAEAVEVAIDVRRRLAPPGMKLVLITDALTLHRPATRAAVERLMANGGEIWAKLDAGTDEYFRRVGRGHVSIERPYENIRELARTHPVVVQSMFLRLHGEPPSGAEIDAYVARLAGLAGEGAKLQRIDVYTVARPTTESWATPLAADEVEAIASRVRAALPPTIPVEAYSATG